MTARRDPRSARLPVLVWAMHPLRGRDDRAHLRVVRSTVLRGSHALAGIWETIPQ
jgi:hypothetical protein